MYNRKNADFCGQNLYCDARSGVTWCNPYSCQEIPLVYSYY